MKDRCGDREKIFALAQNMLSGREQKDVAAHLDVCEKCRSVFQNYQRLDSVLDEWSPAAEPSPWFDARLRAAVTAQAAERSHSFLGLSWGRWMAAPALASLLVVSTLVVFHSFHDFRLAKNGGGSGTRASTVQVKPAAMETQAQSATQELRMYQNLPVLEDYDMLSNFDVISELPKGSHKIAD